MSYFNMDNEELRKVMIDMNLNNYTQLALLIEEKIGVKLKGKSIYNYIYLHGRLSEIMSSYIRKAVNVYKLEQENRELRERSKDV